MSNVNLEDLSLQDEDGFVFDFEEGEEDVVDFRWCLVGRFLGDRSIHVNSMKVTMADVWRPVKGVKIKEATPGLFLFQFAHALDMEAVLQGGPWSFNNQMLIMERVSLGVQIENIPLHHADFWVQVHNLPTGLMAERVGKTLANYIGSFLEYDKNNKGSFWREYMRIRVRVDIRQPLKKDSRVKNQGGEWCVVNFKYEKLGVFCFICGLIGHGENRCVVRFSMTEDDGSRAWSKELKAETRRRSGRQTSWWLTEEDSGRPVHQGSHSQSTDAEQVNLTRPNSPLHQPSHSRQNINYQSLTWTTNIPSPTHNQHQLAYVSITPPAVNATITTNAEKLTDQRIILGNPAVHYTSPSQQPKKTIISPDNIIITQSLPNNNHPITTLTLSPTMNNALNICPPNQFAFTATNRPKLNQTLLQPTRPIKANPNQKNNPSQKTTRTGLTRTGNKPDQTKPVSCSTQQQHDSMEVQTEKKRRREMEKEKEEHPTVIQHFLTAGPGSQDCRDQ
jgi:14-3-3 protein epsilon